MKGPTGRFWSLHFFHLHEYPFPPREISPHGCIITRLASLIFFELYLSRPFMFHTSEFHESLALAPVVGVQSFAIPFNVLDSL